MKLDHGGAALKVSSTHDFEQAGFNIKASAIAFQVLSSGLYQDKIAAVIRELSTNATDGHKLREFGIKAADGSWEVAPIKGRTKLPFKVQMPSQWDPVFSVRDYGVGLDHQGVMQLYTTYFGSTKSDSNDFTGALGLGSKSPFSMASSFLVISYYNGTKRTYTAMIGEDGFPTIVKMEEVNTTEENGLEVRVTVDPSQAQMFKDRAAKIYAFFDTPPNCPGVTVMRPEYERRTARWGIRSKDRYGHARGNIPTGLIMGQICYPITLSAIEGKVKPHIYSLLKLYANQIDIFCEMGDIEFQASREALSYTDKTFKFFDAALEDFYKEQHEQAIAGFRKCKTYTEAVLFMRATDNMTRQILEEDRKKGLLKFRGQPVDWTTELYIPVTEPAQTLGSTFGDHTMQDIKNPPRFTAKLKMIAADNGDTLPDKRWLQRYDPKTQEVVCRFPMRSSQQHKIRIVWNDEGAPMYQIRDHLKAQGWSSSQFVTAMFLIDKKNEPMAKWLADVYEMDYEKISTWNLQAAATVEQFCRLARAFTPSTTSSSTYDLTEKLKDESELKKIRYYMCTNGTAHNYDSPLVKGSTDYISVADVNKYLTAMIRYGFLEKGERIAIVAKTKEAEFQKVMPQIKHITEVCSTRKWTDFDKDAQREISATVFRKNLGTSRFDHKLEDVIGDYAHFMQQVEKMQKVSPLIRAWARDTLNTYKKLAAEVFSRLSKGDRPSEPKAFVSWLETTFKNNLIDFQADIDQLSKTEQTFGEVFPYFLLLRQTYYRNYSARHYGFSPELAECLENLISKDNAEIQAKLLLA